MGDEGKGQGNTTYKPEHSEWKGKDEGPGSNSVGEEGHLQMEAIRFMPLNGNTT